MEYKFNPSFYRIYSKVPYLLIIILLFSFFKVAAQQGQQIAISKDNTTAPFGFYQYLPEGYNDNPGATYPLMIFLHGLGQKGNGTTELPNLMNEYCPPSMIQAGQHFPFIVISPQHRTGWWEHANLKLMMNFIKANYRVDTTRVYITGLSAGATAVWGYASRYPEDVTAIVPISGNGNGLDHCYMKDVPVWTFHGELDDAVSIFGSITPYNNINNCTPKPNPLGACRT